MWFLNWKFLSKRIAMSRVNCLWWDHLNVLIQEDHRPSYLILIPGTTSDKGKQQFWNWKARTIRDHILFSRFFCLRSRGLFTDFAKLLFQIWVRPQRIIRKEREVLYMTWDGMKCPNVPPPHTPQSDCLRDMQTRIDALLSKGLLPYSRDWLTHKHSSTCRRDY